MAWDSMTEPAKVFGSDTIVVAGAFRPNGSSAVSATTDIGDSKGKWSVARTDTGDFTITFAGVSAERPVIVFGITHPTDADLTIQGRAYSAANKTVGCTVLAAATPTDIASDADAWINFVAVFKNSASGD